ncbi:MAG: hypothetical protein ACRDD4_03230 [Culicoidibacterales bacterium]
MWNKIYIDNNQIETNTDRAVLINMPQKSSYAGYKFWHPAKLVRKDAHLYSVSFNETFEFKLFKNGQGKYNTKEVISETVINASEMLDQFERQTDGAEKTLASMENKELHKNDTFKPATLEAETIEIPDELKR